MSPAWVFSSLDEPTQSVGSGMDEQLEFQLPGIQKLWLSEFGSSLCTDVHPFPMFEEAAPVGVTWRDR